MSRLLAQSKELVRPYYLRWLYFPLFPDRKPRYFTDSWSFPVWSPDPEKTREPQILFLPMTDWHTRIQRTQHLARTFAAQGQQCFYMNPHLGREFPRPPLLSDSVAVRSIERGVAELHVHLPLEPVFHERMLRPSEVDFLTAKLKAVLQAANGPKIIQLVSFPIWFPVAERLRREFGYPIVYDCHDVLRGFHNVAREIVEAEPVLLPASDLVLFSSQSLLDENLALNPSLGTKALLVRNAVDESWLDWAQREEGNQGTVIGYVGALDSWFDVEAVELAARHHPEWQFEMIGRVEDNRILKLKKLENVRFTGEIPHAELHMYLARWRVGLIPFLRNELTLGTNPIKLYEYFSYGLPVVATRLPEIEGFENLAYLTGSNEEFVTQLEKAMAEAELPLREKRIQIARQETWRSRAEQLTIAFGKLA